MGSDSSSRCRSRRQQRRSELTVRNAGRWCFCILNPVGWRQRREESLAPRSSRHAGKRSDGYPRPAPRSGRGRSRARSTSLIPCRLTLSGDTCRHASNASLRERLFTTYRPTPRAYRLADACDHAEHTAKPEIGRSDSTARLPSTRSGCSSYHWHFEPPDTCRRESFHRRADSASVRAEVDFPACGVATAGRCARGVAT